jgi:hypothetical protein
MTVVSTRESRRTIYATTSVVIGSVVTHTDPVVKTLLHQDAPNRALNETRPMIGRGDGRNLWIHSSGKR